MSLIKIQVKHKSHITFKQLTSPLYDEIGEEYDISEEEIQDCFSIESQLLIPDDTFITIFKIYLPELELRDRDSEDVIKSYLSSLNNNDSVLSIVKTNDSILFDKAKKYYQEIIELEMELRNTLTYILAYDQKNIARELFKEFGIKQSESFDENHIHNNYENGLFYIYFNHYAAFKKPKDLEAKDITRFLQSPSIRTFEDFKYKLDRRAILEERHLNFISSISDKLKPLEDMRNAIMHIRNLSNNIISNYEKATSGTESINNLIQNFWLHEHEILKLNTWMALAKSQIGRVVSFAGEHEGNQIFKTNDEYHDCELEDRYVGTNALKVDLISYLVDIINMENFDCTLSEIETEIIEMIDFVLSNLVSNFEND